MEERVNYLYNLNIKRSKTFCNLNINFMEENMLIRFSRYLVVLLIIIGFIAINYAFEEDSEITIGVKRGTTLAKKRLKVENPTMSEINFIIYDEKLGKTKILKNMDEVISGQQFLISVNSNKNVYVYVLNVDARNKLYVLFPRKEITHTNPLTGNKDYNFPPGSSKDNDDLMYEFDNTAGIEEFYIYVSDKLIPEIENIIKDVPNEGLNLANNASIKDKLEKARPEEGEKGVVIAKSNKAKTLKLSDGKNLELKPFMIWFKQKYAKKFVFIHKKKANENIAKETIKKANKEKWKDKNLIN